MVHAYALPPRRPGPHPTLVAVCIVLGIVFAVLGPGACTVSCMTAPYAIDEALQVCGDGMTEKCRELAGSDVRIVAGDCTMGPMTVRLHGHALAWSIVDIGRE